jgi:hypothetical protein
VPASFLVGDVVDFVTRMSKLDRYSSKKTSRSLERIFVTGACPPPLLSLPAYLPVVVDMRR